MAYKILDVFNTYCDAYLEYVNNFTTKEFYAEYYDLDENEVNKLFEAAKLLKEKEFPRPWYALDYFYNKVANEDYAEKEIHW